MKKFNLFRSKTTWFATMLGVAALSIVAPNQANAVPVQFAGTGNYYEFGSVANPYSGSNNSFGTASSNAAAAVHLGVNGHLATITSQAENDFLYALAGLSPVYFEGAWIGARANGTGVGEWIEGPEAGSTFAPTFSNLAGSEGNNSGFVYMNIAQGVGPGGSALGQWFDDSGAQGYPDAADPVVGYFIEYETSSVVPIPAALPLFGTGLAIMGFIGWRRKRKAG